MPYKGIAPILIVFIIALAAIGGIGGYTYIKNRYTITETTTNPTTTTTNPTTTTTLMLTKSSEYCLNSDLIFSNAYKDGQAHAEIKRIQEKLGVEPVGGHYGPKTQAAIEAFNKKYGTYSQGCCGHKPEYSVITLGTIAKFNELYCDKFYTIKIKTRNINSPSNCPSEIGSILIPKVTIIQYPGTTWIDLPFEIS